MGCEHRKIPVVPTNNFGGYVNKKRKRKKLKSEICKSQTFWKKGKERTIRFHLKYFVTLLKFFRPGYPILPPYSAGSILRTPTPPLRKKIRKSFIFIFFNFRLPKLLETFVTKFHIQCSYFVRIILWLDLIMFQNDESCFQKPIFHLLARNISHSFLKWEK